jgi:hypothetical protein
MEEFMDALAACSRLLGSKVAAALKGEDFSAESELVRAENWKDNAKQAIVAHQEEHG